MVLGTGLEQGAVNGREHSCSNGWRQSVLYAAPTLQASTPPGGPVLSCLPALRPTGAATTAHIGMGSSKAGDSTRRRRREVSMRRMP